MLTQTRKKTAIDILFELAGTFVMAIGINCFSDPAQIAPGGVSGISIMARYLWGLPIGLTGLIINIPLLLLAWKYIGKKFTLRTFRAILFSTIMLDYVVAPFIPAYTGERLLGSIFGGVLAGAGLGLVFVRGTSTGGTDILSFLIQLKFPHVPIGKALMFVDCLVLGLSILVFRNIESGLFGLVALFCQSKMIDSLMYGSNQGQMFLIISPKEKEISKAIIERMDRGATLLQGRGAYTGAEQEVLLCAARKREYGALTRIVREIDPDAFVIVSEVSQILGEGFRPVEDNTYQ